MRRIPIRLKLAVALSVPLIAMGLVTMIEVISVNREATEVGQQTQLATAAVGPKGFITALQNERNFASADLVGVDADLPMAILGYPESRGAADEALAEFEAELDGLTDSARAAYAPALEGLAALEQLRADIDVEAAKPNRSLQNIGFTTGIFDRYTDVIEPFFGGMSRISIAMDDPELRQGAELMEVVTRQLETVPQLANDLIMPATVSTGPGDTAGINSPSEIATLAERQDTFRRQAEAPARRRPARTPRSPPSGSPRSSPQRSTPPSTRASAPRPSTPPRCWRRSTALRRARPTWPTWATGTRSPAPSTSGPRTSPPTPTAASAASAS